jgi:hypothetical protein
MELTADQRAELRAHGEGRMKKDIAVLAGVSRDSGSVAGQIRR